MKLMTKELEKVPLYSKDSKGFDSEVIVKYFNPCGAGTWLITGKWRLVIFWVLLYNKMGMGLCKII